MARSIVDALRPSSRRPDIQFVGFVGGTGGASSCMRELAAGFRARGYDTRIVVPSWEPTIAYAESCAELGVPVERTGKLTFNRSWRRNVFDAARCIRAHRAPVVHYHLSDDFLDPAFMRAMNFVRPAAAIATMHSPYDRLPDDQRVMQQWSRVAAQRFRRVICVSRDSQRRQIRNGVPSERTTLIYNGIDVARFAAGAASAARSELPDLPPDARLVLSTARLDEQKQPLSAVAAFARVAAEFPDVHLVMMGRGPLESATRAAAEESGVGGRIHLVGQRNNVADWLAAASVWVLPTLGEGFSMAVIEAMAAGCAIVSTRCAGNDEVLEDGVNALTVPVGDVGELARALRRVLVDPALGARLGAAARATAARYSLDSVIDQHLACYGLPSSKLTSNSQERMDQVRAAGARHVA